MPRNASFYYWTGLFNLAVVALLGMLMRYKIGFDFPIFSQKNILHAHSHFAFSGWVAHTLYWCIAAYIQLDNSAFYNRFIRLIQLNLLLSAAMLISFFVQGYGPVSIIFSTMTILVGYAFGWNYWQYFRKATAPSAAGKWFLSALFFNALSSLGTFYLAWIMLSHQFNQSYYLSSVYFYLHFQYSGWFFFGLMGLFITLLEKFSISLSDSLMFRLFFVACFPAYLLSLLWANLPWYLYGLTVAAVLMQLLALFFTLKEILKCKPILKTRLPKLVKILFSLSVISLIIKIFLQAGSVIPEISKLAFGFRSIVIAYLHLVLLGITTLFLIGYGIVSGWIHETKITRRAIMLFTLSVFANEVVLTLQGTAGIFYFVIPKMNETLFFISVFLFASIVILVVDQVLRKKEPL